MAEEITAAGLKARVDKMGLWAAGVERDIADLRVRIAPTVEHCDKIASELADLYAQYSDIRSLIQVSDEHISSCAHAIADADDEIAAIEAETMLDVSSKYGPDNKPLYSSEGVRKAAVIVELRKNKNYIEAMNRKRNVEREIATEKALRGSLDNALSEYRNRTRALVAILDNFTARISLAK